MTLWARTFNLILLTALEELQKILLVAQSPAEVLFRLLFALILFTFLGLAFTPRPWGTFLSPIIGQCVALVYVMIRSVLAQHFGWAQAISKYEVMVIAFVLCSLGFIAFFINGFVNNFKGAFALLLLALLLWPVFIYWDWPMVLMRSGDATSYAYFSHTIFTRGGIPWHQLPLGPEPLGYPAGIGALCAAWMAFSGLSALEVFPLILGIQCTLVLVFLIGVLRQNESNSEALTWAMVVVAALVFLAYPYFYAVNPDGAAWGRASSIAFLAVPLVFLQLFRDFSQAKWVFLFLCILGLFSPAQPLLLASIFMCRIFFSPSYRKFWSPKNFVFLSSLGALLLGLLIYADPYYYKMLIEKDVYLASATEAGVGVQKSLTALWDPTHFWNELYLYIKQLPQQLFDSDIVQPKTTFLFLVVAWILSLGRTRFIRLVFFPALVCGVLTSFLSPNHGVVSTLLSAHIKIQINWFVWVGMVLSALQVAVVFFRPPRLLWLVSIRRWLFVLWVLTLPWYSNIKFFAKRHDWKGEGWDRVTPEFVSNLKLYKEERLESQKVLLLPTKSGIVLEREALVYPISPYQVYAFLPDTYVSFLNGIGNREYNGKRHLALGLNEYYAADGKVLKPFSTEIQKWIQQQKLVVWP